MIVTNQKIIVGAKSSKIKHFFDEYHQAIFYSLLLTVITKPNSSDKKRFQNYPHYILSIRAIVNVVDFSSLLVKTNIYLGRV